MHHIILTSFVDWTFHVKTYHHSYSFNMPNYLSHFSKCGYSANVSHKGHPECYKQYWEPQSVREVTKHTAYTVDVKYEKANLQEIINVHC